MWSYLRYATIPWEMVIPIPHFMMYVIISIQIFTILSLTGGGPRFFFGGVGRTCTEYWDFDQFVLKPSVMSSHEYFTNRVFIWLPFRKYASLTTICPWGPKWKSLNSIQIARSMFVVTRFIILKVIFSRIF